MTVTLTTAPFLAGGPLYRDYIDARGSDAAAVAAVRGLFDCDLASIPEAARQRARAVDEQYKSDRRRLASALVAYNRRLDAPGPALAQAARLAEPQSLAVVAGQQSGLLGGPLYSLYKAIGAVTVAARLEALLGRPVVPVFWAATEDHDLAEADNAWLMTSTEAWTRLRYRPATPQQGLSVGAVQLQGGIVEMLLAELDELLPGTGAGREAFKLAAAAGRSARTLGDWFARFMAQVTGPLGLAVLDPREPEMRSLAAPGVRAVLRNQDCLSSALARGSDAVRALGYEPQLAADPLDAQLFIHPDGPDGPRRALAHGGDGHPGLTIRGDGAAPSWSCATLLDRLDSQPEVFSGNVVTRPLFQDTILPTVAYIAGPSEIAYYAMLRGCYQAMGLPSLIWPRPSYTIIEPVVGRLLSKRGLGRPDLPAALDQARTDVVRRADSIGIDKLFGAAQAQVGDLYSGFDPNSVSLTRCSAIWPQPMRPACGGNWSGSSASPGRWRGSAPRTPSAS